MVNYSNGKVYKIEPIVNHDEGDIYIGSTTKQYLSQRMDSHRSGYKRYLKGCYNLTTSYTLFDKYGVENCCIILLENVYANSKDELQSRERYYIQTLKCINRYNPLNYKTEEYRKLYKKQYTINNQEYITEYTYQRYHKLKDILTAKVKCDVCNCYISKQHIRRHENTPKHKISLSLIEYEYFYNDGTPCTEDEYNLYNN